MGPRIINRSDDIPNKSPDAGPRVRGEDLDNCTLTQRNPEGHLSEPVNPGTSNSVESISPASGGREGGMIGEG